jgi:uncharacterized damage-inducible protein DinB
VSAKPIDKRGRPRRYDLQVSSDLADNTVAWAAAALDELRARVIDQFIDLPRVALRFVPEGSTLSIAALVEHLVWAEEGWIRRISGVEAPDDLHAAVLKAGRAVPAGDLAVPDVDADDLVGLCRRLRDEVTLPALASLVDIDAQIRTDSQPATPRGVLMHLIWHWTYHSGHIGLLRELWGSGYTWTFEAREGG